MAPIMMYLGPIYNGRHGRDSDREQCALGFISPHEELDAIMAGFPFGPFSQVEIYPLADLNSGLDAFDQAIQQMTGGH
jgi:hypothetical protein